eukprot:s799_g2.t1
MCVCVQRIRGCFNIAPFFQLHLIICDDLTDHGIAGSYGQLQLGVNLLDVASAPGVDHLLLGVPLGVAGSAAQLGQEARRLGTHIKFLHFLIHARGEAELISLSQGWGCTGQSHDETGQDSAAE